MNLVLNPFYFKIFSFYNMSKTGAKDSNKGTNKDLYKAFYWHRNAAENGDIEAQSNLAKLYEEGKGTEKDLKKAFYWYQKAAKNNVKEAQYILALSYYDGEGTEKNFEK